MKIANRLQLLGYFHAAKNDLRLLQGLDLFQGPALPPPAVCCIIRT